MNYKIFTIEEFNHNVKIYWDMMIKSEFPEWECVPIQHDISKRRTRNLGKAHYKSIKVDGKRKMIPDKLSFAYTMLDGRYTLESVRDVILHEIGHQLDILRNGRSSGHGDNFKKIADEFGFNDGRIFYGLEHSEIHDILVRNESKYHLICDCGKINYYKRKPWWVDYMVIRGHTGEMRSCKICGKEDFTLYIFPNGIETDALEIDYEAYANLVGAKIIRKKED